MKHSNTISVIKAFAILTIICAHCSTVASTASAPVQFASYLLQSAGCIGVPIFLGISGWLFASKTYTFKTLVVKKASSLILPWFVIGTFVYLYVALRKGGDIYSYFAFLLGIGSYLYYMSVLMSLFLVFWLLHRHAVFLTVLCILSLCSIVLSSLSTAAYCNPLNWILYFGIGFFLKQSGHTEKILSFCTRFYLVFLSLALAVICLFAFFRYPMNYWSHCYFLLLLPWVLAISGCARKWSENRILQTLGSYSFAIYLLHMPVAGITVHFTQAFHSVAVVLLRPFFILCCTFILLRLYEFVVIHLRLPGFFLQILAIPDNRQKTVP